jgi:hypothetical protein
MQIKERLIEQYGRDGNDDSYCVRQSYQATIQPIVRLPVRVGEAEM